MERQDSCLTKADIDIDKGLIAASAENIYHTLPQDTIRLLEISHDPQVTCTLTAFPFHDVPAFVALSYTWGHPPDNRAIRINGYHKVIRENLWQFLVSMRGHSISKYFWIDAICINQANLTERLQQVSLMPRIYQDASSVLIWLGPAGGGSDIAMDFLAGYDRRQGSPWYRSDGADILVVSLCRRVYWTRLWIFQEAVLARNILLMCGQKLAPWETFCSMVLNPPDLSPEINPQGCLVHQSPAAHILKYIEQATHKSTLFDNIIATQTLQCTEARDRVYALLGLSSRDREDIVPDYSVAIAALLNIVLASHHRVHPPPSIELVEQQCLQLDEVFGRMSDHYSIFRLEDGHTRLPDPEDLARYSLSREHSRVSLWWAAHYRHEHIIALLMKDAATDVTGALRRALNDMSFHTSKLILDNGAGRWSHDGNMREGLKRCLYYAAEGGLVEFVALLIEHDVGIKSEHGFQHSFPLSMALRGCHLEVAELLLKAGADINVGKGYDRALFSAAAQGNSVLTELLLSRGAHGYNEHWCGVFSSALQTASARGHLQIVRMLLDQDTAISTESRNLALGDAAGGNHLEVMQLLLDHGISDLAFAFRKASREGRYKAVKLLLAVTATDGADTVGKDHLWALHAAAGRGDNNMLNLLLDNGASINASDASGTALHSASRCSKYETVKLLLDRGADVNRHTTFGFPTALHCACLALDPNIEIVRLLLDRGADICIQSAKYGTALHAACGNIHGEPDLELVMLLLDQGIGVNTRGGRYRSALQAACDRQEGAVGLVELLLDKGADLNLQGGRYGSALGAACYPARPNLELTKILLEKGADVSTLGSTLKNVMEELERYGHHGVVQLLRRYGA